MPCFKPTLPLRTCVVLGIDIVMTALSVVATYILLHGFGGLIDGRFSEAMILLTVLALIVYPSYGIYRNHWRYTSITDLSLLAQSAVFLIAMFYGLWWALCFPEISPATTFPIIHLMTLLFALGGPRVLRRMIADPQFTARAFAGSSTQQKRSILLVATPDEAEIFIRAQSVMSQDTAFRILGICDPRGASIGRAIHGVSVIGSPKDLEKILDELKETPNRLGVSKTGLESLPKNFEEICARYGLSIGRLPSSGDIGDLNGASQLLKPIAIEDVLGRGQQSINLKPVAEMLKGQTVLITGAGGSIGSEIVRQIAGLKPKQIIATDLSELGVYEIERTLKTDFKEVKSTSLIGDVRDKVAMDIIVKKYKPEFIYHAAALKHVPIVQEQPEHAIVTNITGTRNMAELALTYKAKGFILISTDKAVAPSSLMGASKRVAEMIVKNMDHKDAKTRFACVRFGNVLGSSGSVVPLFRAQIERGGPITVTHPDMTRFFMTIREAVGLVLQTSAFVMDTPKDRGYTYILDMGRAVKIVDVANQMIRLAGLTPDKDIKVEFIGLRPGEKLDEELFCGTEKPETIKLKTVSRAKGDVIKDTDLKALIKAGAMGDKAKIIKAFATIIDDLQIKA